MVMARPPSTVSRLPAAAASTARTATVMETLAMKGSRCMGGMFGVLGMFMGFQRGICHGSDSMSRLRISEGTA